MADLITLQNYKDYKQVSSDTDDTKTNTIIPTISDLIKNYCGRSFIDYFSDPKTEYDNGGHNSVFLTEIPIIEIVNLQLSDDNHQTSTTLEEDKDFYVDYDEGVIYKADKSNFPRAFHSIKIEYKAGFQDTPSDIKLAAYNLLDYYIKEEYKHKKSLSSATIEFLEVNDIPGHIKRTLDSYRIFSL